ncbi:phosphotransferase [Calditrichota bacterium GD2]
MLKAKAERKFKKYFAQGLLALSYGQLIEKIVPVLQAPKDSLEIRQIIDRPFSVIMEVVMDEGRSFFVKVYKLRNPEKQRAELEREFAVSRFWFDKFKDDPEHRVIEPIWLDVENLILITRKSEGENLLKLTGRLHLFPAKRVQQRVHRSLSQAGQWLKKFQSFSIVEEVPYVKPPVGLTFSFLEDYILIRLQRMVQNPKLNFDEHFQQKIIDYLKSLWQKAGAQSERLTFAHTDFSLSNILAAENKVTVLDFNKCEINSPYKDLSRFYHQLYLLSFKPTFQKSVIEEMKASFLQGYGAPQAKDHPMFQIFFIIHQVTHLGKISRFWERGLLENVYNHYLVSRVLKDLKQTALI